MSSLSLLALLLLAVQVGGCDDLLIERTEELLDEIESGQAVVITAVDAPTEPLDDTQRFDWTGVFGRCQSSYCGKGVAASYGETVVAGATYTDSVSVGGEQLLALEAQRSPQAGEGAVRWVHQITGGKFMPILDMTADQQGNVFVLGYAIEGPISTGDVTLSLEEQSTFLASYAPDGTVRWVREVAHVPVPVSTTNPYMTIPQGGITLGPGGEVFVTGGVGSQRTGVAYHPGFGFFLAQFDDRGNRIWVERAENATATDLVAQDGHLLVTGFYSGSTRLGGQQLEAPDLDVAFLARYDLSGEGQWLRRWNGDGSWGNRALSVAAAPDGSVFVTGSYSGALELGGETAQTTDPDGVNAILVSYDAAGNLRWVDAVESSVWNAGGSVALDASGTVVLAVSTETGESLVFGFDPAGTKLWREEVGYFSLFSAFGNDMGLTRAPNGDLYIAGLGGSNDDDLLFGHPGLLTGADNLALVLARLPGGG